MRIEAAEARREYQGIEECLAKTIEQSNEENTTTSVYLGPRVRTSTTKIQLMEVKILMKAIILMLRIQIEPMATTPMHSMFR